MVAYRKAVAECNDGQPVVASSPTVDVKLPRLVATVGRGPRPRIASGLSIGEYRASELQALVRWIVSDGRLREHGELVEDMMRELGFDRRGSRIEDALYAAIGTVTADSQGRN